MRVVNVCGFGLTGCTSQADFLSEYSGVRGILGHELRNKNICRAPYQEFGLLKCRYSLGGLVLAKITGKKIGFDKSILHRSLLGQLPREGGQDWDIYEKAHLRNRAFIVEEYGDKYLGVVEQTMDCLPKFSNIKTLEQAMFYVSEALGVWLDGVFSLVREKNGRYTEIIQVIGLKNDPNGANPLLSGLIKNGITSAIFRRPEDTVFDYMRHYNLPKTVEVAAQQAQRYNQTMDSAKKQITRYRKEIGDKWFAHEFESFVTSNEHRQRYLMRMVGSRQRVREYFQPEVSASNIGLYTKQDSCITDIVNRNCERKYVEFKEFLDREDLLL